MPLSQKTQNINDRSNIVINSIIPEKWSTSKKKTTEEGLMLTKDLENKVTDELITLSVDFVYLQLLGRELGVTISVSHGSVGNR